METKNAAEAQTGEAGALKVLVAGAGAVGGYLAARLIEAGQDVTLLVRERRERQLKQHGLTVISPTGDTRCEPRTIKAGEPGGPFDLIVLATKAYGLPETLQQMKPYLHEESAILPFLNGIKHMDDIAAAYPGQPLLGGVARIESTLDEEGRVVHITPYSSYRYGTYSHTSPALMERVRAALSGVSSVKEHTDIARDMRDKYLLLSALSGVTTLFQASVGDIRDTGDGLRWFEQALAENAAVIRTAIGPLDDGIVERLLAVIAGMSAASTSSMLRDLNAGLPTEAAHIHGHLLKLARKHECSVPLLETIWQRLAVYEHQRESKLG
ncbi:ketopantoate reductase family protein [Cohnella faecalis]|uniref:2-dehydropantoate 2-reductase n=1 Tax=Cohnella faecalis TaxID=2315694 RepID=A0A398CIK8_9BACL|nr:ketopantoate reductase family protein [Cohnella faecalis]RIE01902.1 ketopantoate reductase family protein [Cohnella faecalis]